MRLRHFSVAAAVALALAAAYVSTRTGREDSRLAVPPDAATTRVTRVTDGDTVTLANAGKARLIGVDTPEVFGGEECFGPQASAFTKRTLAGTEVRYTRGAEQRDRYGRLLVYLWLPDGRSFNELLLREGYARTLTIAPNTRHARPFAALSAAARARRRGLWSACS